MKGGAKVVVEPHRHEGVFVARGKEDALCTLNSAPGKVGDIRLDGLWSFYHQPLLQPFPRVIHYKCNNRHWNRFAETVKLFYRRLVSSKCILEKRTWSVEELVELYLWKKCFLDQLLQVRTRLPYCLVYFISQMISTSAASLRSITFSLSVLARTNRALAEGFHETRFLFQLVPQVLTNL